MEQLKLNMIPNGVNPVFHASQYDKGRQIRFVLDETLSSAEVTVSYRAKDGTEYGNVQMSVSGNTITDTIPEEVLTDYGIIEGEVNIDGIGSLNFFVEVEKDAYDGGVITTQTASGPIATFETNIETAFASLTADITPVQDLHGYSKPWSGGGGKNKLNCTATTETKNGVTLTVVKNSANQVTQINVSGTATAGVSFTLGTATIEAGTYVLNGYTGGSSVGTKYINYSGIVNAYGSNVTSTISETKTTTASLQIANGAETGFTIYPMIRLSNTSADFEPYSNICPISGFSALNVTRTGKNWANNTATSQTISGVAYTVSTDGRVKANGTASGASIIDIGSITLLGGNSYVLSGCPSGGSGSTYALFLRGSGSFAQKIDFGGGNLFSVTETVTTTLSIIVYNGYTASDLTFEPMVRLSDTTADFEPYNGQTATVNFGQTVYGGVADVTGGKVNVTHAKYLFDNTLSESDIAITLASGYTQISYLPIISVGVGNSPFVSDRFENVPQLQAGLNKVWNSNSETAPRLFFGLPDTVTTKAQAVAWFASNPTEVVYELATPTEITTTPENLTALSGQNNVYSDTNGDTEVEYYIEV